MINRHNRLIPFLAGIDRRTLAKSEAIGILLFSICFIFCGLFPVASWAHAFPIRSDPKVGDTIESSPDIIKIWFDSELEPALSKLMVCNADGKQVDKQDSGVDADDPKLLKVSVPPLPSGRYRVIWSVGAKDGHRTKGDFTFTVK
jgi:methionine-rich copper-binding protein CopC